jgi:cold shock CspA family protein
MHALNLDFVSQETIVLVSESRCTIKWYKKEDGYGFVNHSSIDHDIFLHESKIDREFLPNIKAGQIIICTIVRGLRGPQVNKIFEYDVPHANIICYGALKWFNLKQSFGFVSINDPQSVESQCDIKLHKPDIFVSLDVLKDSKIPCKHGTIVKCNFIIDANHNNVMQSMELHQE